jgi:PIN domain nuclease of toxin-antitoxin system
LELLIDSHILLRLDSEPHLVPEYQRNALADLSNDVFVSAASAWELGIKQRKGKLNLARTVSEQCALLGFQELSVTFVHAEFAAKLPLLHNDPFDRMLVAQAIIEGMVLVTADERLREYPVEIL